jgi:uncharacterized membrane protein
MEISGPVKQRGTPWKWLVLIAAGIVVIVWLMLTPSGLLGKADAIGYAVCHRIDARSFHIGDRQMPLCARCTGMYLGALAGMLYQIIQGRRGGMPNWKTYAILALFVIAFGVDGANSYLHFFPMAPSLYQPQNWLRLVTGTGMGLAISAVLLPVFHQTMWATWDTHSAINHPRHWLAFLGLGIVVDLATLSNSPWVLFPLALFSSAEVVIILTMVYSMVTVMLFKQENRFKHLKDLWLPLVAGLTIAILQIGVMDLGRFLLTRTWSGFNLG